MTQHFNDFSQYTAGTFPADWLAFTEATDGSGGVGDTRHLNVVDLAAEGVGTGQGLKFDAAGTTASGSYSRLYMWDAIAASADVEIYFEFLLSSDSPSLAECLGAVRADFAGLPTKNWYQGGVRPNDLDLNKWVGGTFTNLANDTSVDWLDDGLWQKCRLRANGTTLSVMVWTGATQPGSFSVVDTDADLTTGKVGITTFRERKFYVRNLGVADAGEAAPTAPVSSGPTISNVDGDNAVDQGQLVNIDVSNFTETITSGDINGVAFPSIPDNDPTDDVIWVRIPVTLTDGTYDVTISGATETDTISGVTYTVTHPYEAPYGQVDSNSDWQGQKLTEDTYWRVITPFAHGTYDFVAGAAETPPFGNDINDHFTAEAGYEGPDSEIREVMYADGTTAQYTVNIEISDGTAEVDWPFSKQIRYAATKNWTWGSRHPKTGMRVRIFK